MSPVRRILLPLAALLTVAGALGLLWGVRAVPPSDTEIIEGVAARYVAETGGQRTDCYARPSGLPEVRLVVICEPAGGVARAYAVDAQGAIVEIAADRLTEVPET